MHPLTFITAKLALTATIPKIFNEAWDYIAKQLNECCEPAKPKRKYFIQADYPVIMGLRKEWIIHNDKTNHIEDKWTVQELVDLTNKQLDLNKSVVAYRNVWFGRIKKADMLKKVKNI